MSPQFGLSLGGAMRQNKRINSHATMPTAAERQALAFLAGVALLGGGVRVWQQRHDAASLASTSALSANAETVDGQLSAIDAARSSKRAKKGKKPKAASGSAELNQRSSARVRSATANSEGPLMIDVDVASAAELEKLPRVGAALANRIVANRDSFGAFGSLEALGTVRGIGDAMLKTLDPVVMFSGRPRAPLVEETRPKSSRRKRKL